MWLLLTFLLRPLLKLIGVTLLFWLALTAIQMMASLFVAAWEHYVGTQVPQDVFLGLCIVLIANLLFLYVRHGWRVRPKG